MFGPHFSKARHGNQRECRYLKAVYSADNKISIIKTTSC